ncbi:hypothetical protein [Glycomyces albidus]|uniref:DUF3618 domain-containing protein n=1 Tax=Glycomyces albidus TaxID=2656774 RepID=A0A6L5GAX1_9ACTN|nr:hypothetical protein [Glycomyces albidus]MQM26736.1 hypothetical protein [Glycomyces albidus]
MQSTYGHDGSGTGGKPAETAHKTKDAAKEVAGTAKEEARHLGDQVKSEVQSITEDTREQLRQHASEQADKVSGSLRRLGDQAGALAEGRPEDAGPLADYMNTAAERLRHVAERTEERGFEGLIDDTKRFARERPALFLGLAAVAGFAAGRLMRGGVASRKEQADREPRREDWTQRDQSTAPQTYTREPRPYPVENDMQEPYVRETGPYPMEDAAGQRFRPSEYPRD